MGVKNGLPAQEHLLVIPLVEPKNAYFQKRPEPLWGSDVINPRSWTAARHGIGAAAGQCKFATPAVSRIARHVIGLRPDRELVELGAEQCERRQRQDGRRQRPREE